MVTQGGLTRDDVKRIKHEKTTPEQVDELIGTLLKKPLTAYDTFMEILENKRYDLFEIVHSIEIGCQYHGTGELKFKSQISL